MWFRLFLVFAVLSTSFNGYSKPRAYFEINDSFWQPKPRFVIDGKDYKLGFWGFSNLPEAFASDDKARELAEQYELYRNWQLGSAWTGIGLSLVYLLATESDDRDMGVYWGVLLTGLIVSMYTGSRAQRSLLRATNQYNGAYDSENKESVSYQVSPADKGLGLAIHF